jgi:hypothetical protein
VKGFSTQLSWGRNRIDVRSKVEAFARHGTVVNGLKIVNGNVKLALNGNVPQAINNNGVGIAVAKAA